MSSLTVYAPQITILDNAVKVINGLFCLNDLHKASGGEKKHQPSFFMRNQETTDLINEIKLSDNLEDANVMQRINGGDMRGTYVCKDLVYRYAMWISPKFALLVIRTFDKLVTGELRVQPTGISTVADRKPLVAAVNTFCSKTSAIYSDVWKMIHQRFGLEGVHEMTVEQVPQAIDYVHGLLAQVQYGGLNVDIAMDNEMWRCVGILKYYELSKALDEAKKAVNVLYSAIGSAQSHGSLVYDAFGEQRKLTTLGEGGSHTALEQAKAFIERQDARKQIWGGR
ncbi:KilA-N domain-containing protein [Psychrobacter namhaensis]|uniref:KilA-N domain-containing protein n=1 Tax=Psychrobacter namhaensis TaxID=292734 RepID=A0ABW8L4Q2_9GAMM